MDLDDLLDGFGPDLFKSKRAKGVLRVFFGLLGAGLAVALFGFMGAFCLINVTFARRTSWPWKGFVAAFVLLFVVRIVFGP